MSNKRKRKQIKRAVLAQTKQAVALQLRKEHVNPEWIKKELSKPGTNKAIKQTIGKHLGGHLTVHNTIMNLGVRTRWRHYIDDIKMQFATGPFDAYRGQVKNNILNAANRINNIKPGFYHAIMKAADGNIKLVAAWIYDYYGVVMHSGDYYDENPQYVDEVNYENLRTNVYYETEGAQLPE